MAEQIRDSVSRVRMSFQPDGENLIVDVWLEPEGGLPPHLHPRQEERWSVVEGRAGVRVGNRSLEATPADGEIVVAANEVHEIRSVTDDEAHLRCRVVPALHLQQFLTESCE